MTLAPVLALASDPGAASALAPVLARLRFQGWPVRALAYRQAGPTWASRGLAYEEVAEDLDSAAAANLLGQGRTRLLLAGTAFNGVRLEQRFVAAARQTGVPSLVLLDFWSNYRARFADESGQLAPLPDRIAVMDDWAREEMMAEGFEPGRLVVTGQPAFDELVVVRGRAQPVGRTAFRQGLGISDKEGLVLFASQPLAELYGEDKTDLLHPGYTQRTVLNSTLAALERIAGRRHEGITLLVRPHPREQAETFAGYQGQVVRMMVSREGDRHEAALAADLVVGMSTVLLVEACLLGCVVLSLQPGLCQTDSVPTNRWGASQAVYREEEIEPALETLLFDVQARDRLKARADSTRFIPDATERVIGLMDDLLSTSAPI